MSDLRFGEMAFANVMSFGNVEQKIDFSKTGTFHVIGENLDEGGSSGAGKTTIMSILSWLLYDKVPSGISKDRLINNINDAKNVTMKGRIQFWSGADEYTIKKTRGANVLGQLFKNGKDETPAGVNLFNAKIEEIIGYSFELFSRLVIFNGSATPFLDLPARDQREMIEELFKITLLSRKAEKLKETAKETGAQLKLQTTLYERSKEQYQKDLTKYESDLLSAEDKFTSWTTTEETRLNGERQSAHAALASLKQKFTSWSDEAQATLATSIVSLEKKLKEWDVQEEGEQASRLSNLEMLITGFKPKLIKLEADLAATDEATPEKIAELAKLADDRKVIEAEQRLVATNIKNMLAQTKSAKTKVDDLVAQIEHLADNTCPFCKQAFADAKSKVAELAEELEEETKQWKWSEDEVGNQNASYENLAKQLTTLPAYDADLHQQLIKLHSSRASIEVELGKVNTAVASKQTELDFLRANPQAKRPNPYVDQLKTAEQKLADFDPAHNPFAAQLAVAEQKLADVADVQVDETKNPFRSQLEYLADNEPKKPDTSVETELNSLVRLKEHQDVLVKLLTDKNSFIRKGIISKTLPFLNKRIGYYTQRLGLPHIISFQPDLTVSITKLGCELDHGNLSNGEKQRLNFSLCLSFRDALTYLHSRISLLVTDEIDGGKLDEQAINNIIQLIKHKAWDDKLAIYNISHSPFFDGRCDHTLVVRKEGGFSKLIKQLDS